MGDPCLDGTYFWWHLPGPSPELLAAAEDGWLGPAGVAVDLGCGLGTEASFLAASGWAAIGVDLSAAAVRAASASQAGLTFLRADRRSRGVIQAETPVPFGLTEIFFSGHSEAFSGRSGRDSLMGKGLCGMRLSCRLNAWTSFEGVTKCTITVKTAPRL
jgi:SAM-dependent methyltransferase